MNTDQFKEKALVIIANYLKLNGKVVRRRGINWNTHLVNDLNLDSLDLVELAMDLEDEFQISMPDEQIGQVGTVGELILIAIAIAIAQSPNHRYIDANELKEMGFDKRIINEAVANGDVDVFANQPSSEVIKNITDACIQELIDWNQTPNESKLTLEEIFQAFQIRINKNND